MVTAAHFKGTIEVLRRLKPYIEAGYWLPPGNPCSILPYVQMTKQSTFLGLFPGSAPHVGEHLASCTALHLADGWSYLTAAMSAHARGDRHIATHLAYYAELRAARSLLASGGIGIYNNRHCLIDNKGSCRLIMRPTGSPVTTGTHQYAWEALQEWAQLPAANDLLGKSIQPWGTPLSAYLTAFTPGSSGAPGRLTLDMALDLKQFTNDHEARKTASYGPTGLELRRTLRPWRSVKWFRGFWQCFEPGGVLGSFYHIDEALLRIAVTTAWERTVSRPAWSSVKVPQYDASVDNMLTNMTPQPGSSMLVKQGLANGPVEDSSLPLVLQLARRDKTDDRRLYHLEVLARAAVLLRIAAGASHYVIKEAGIDVAALIPWWWRVGIDRGAWEKGPAPPIPSQEISSRWRDKDEALAKLEDWVTRSDPKAQDRYRWYDACGVSIARVCECESLLAWGLA